MLNNLRRLSLIKRSNTKSESDTLDSPSAENPNQLPSLSQRTAAPRVKSIDEYGFVRNNIDPLTEWSELRLQQATNSGTSSSVSLPKEKVYESKIKFAPNSQQILLASTRIIEKFSDDNFDYYLVEMGILDYDQCGLKFEDYMSEIEILKACNHKNIVKFYDCFYFDKKLWIFNEYCSGGTVEKLLYDIKRHFTQTEIHFIISEILEALAYLHERQGIVHRDLNLSNVVINEDGNVKLSNFIIAAKNKSTNEVDDRYLFIRSPHYLPPEVLACKKNKNYNNYNSPKVDIWSLGISAIEMAERVIPFDDLNPEAAVDEIAKLNSMPKLRDIHKWSSSFVDFINKCVEIKSENRSNAKDLLKHSFIVNIRSDENDMRNLLTERKEKNFSSAKNSIDELDKCLSTLKLLREQPTQFVQEQFDALKSVVSEHASNARKQIDEYENDMLKQLEQHEAMCLKAANANGLSDKEKQQCASLEENLQQAIRINRSLVVDTNSNPSDQMLAQAEKESDLLKQNFYRELDVIKATNFFQQKNYSFRPKELEQNPFGQLRIVDAQLTSNINYPHLTKIKSINKDEMHSIKSKMHAKILRLELHHSKRKNSVVEMQPY